MNRHRYDPQRATALVPLLRAITQELQERSDAVEALGRALDRATRTNRRRDRRGELEAQLSVHRRELRLACRELERLGCSLDGDHPLRVLIPGADGALEHGWAWSPLDETFRSVEMATR